MRPNQNQDTGEQKKSVFDRLGRQLDTGRAANRRSPAQYGEHPMHPGLQEPLEFPAGVRYMRGDGHPEMDWRYQQNDRRNVPFGRDRHPSQVGPPPMPMPMPPPSHYEMDGMPPGRQAPPYYQHPPPPHFQPGPPGMPIMGGPEPMPIGMPHQRRTSPKYDRHGNPIRSSMRLNQPPGMTSPRNFMGPPMPGPMMPPGIYDMMPPMRPEMYPPNRWPESPDMGPQMHGGRILPDDRFMEPPNRFMQQQQQMKPPMMMNPEMGGMHANFEAPRYSKWRERRDVITHLDRQTAQSSSKTDSLKSSLQQSENKSNMSRKSKNARSNQQSNLNKQQVATQRASDVSKDRIETTTIKESAKDDPPSNKSGPQDISDGEIVDDEDSSDDSEAAKESSFVNSMENDLSSRQNSRHKGPFARKPTDNLPLFDPAKRRRLHDRDEYSMDYETISDDELNNFMSEKKSADDDRTDGQNLKKNSSEMELLNALGLDWANLIELTRQSRKDTQTTDSALRRFALPNYIPTLGITRDLAGPEIFDLLMKVVQ